MTRHRTLLVACAALVWFAIAASTSAAAPSYGDWSAPVNLGPVVNSAASELGPALSGGGLSLYISVTKPGGFGGNDIWVSQRATVSDAWGAPVNLGATINTAATEFVPAFSEDGHRMFFASDRAGGSGGQDIYQSYRSDVHNDFGWQTPTNLGTGVNSTADDNASTYFDNGGHPQLIFGSGRLGGAARDLFLSNLQPDGTPDGTWGPATLIPELSSPTTENRPTIRQDGLEIFFYSDRPGGVGGTDLWTATRTTVDAPWGTPVNLGATVNSNATDQHPYLSADGRTLIFASNRPGGIGTGNLDLWMTTRNANLTVTANDQARLFGQANPPLTYAITGFVGADTSAVVSGTAACATTATPSSPAGDYPITCTVGTLAAPGYSFATFAAGTLTVGYTTPCLTGTHTGPLTVSAGQSICIGAGGAQTGPLRVNPGGSLDVEGGKITGPLTASGAAVLRLCGATLTGPLTISGSTGLVLVGGDAATGPCAGNTITGPVTLSGNTAGVEFNGNTVVGPVRITGTTGSVPAPDVGAVHADGNSVTGPVSGPVTGSGLSPQVALEWNSNAVDAVRAAKTMDGVPAGGAPRAFYQSEGIIYLAYVQAAVYDAVTKIAHRYEPYHSFSAATGNASAEAAVVAASYNTLTFYLGDPGGVLAAKYAASIAALPADSATDRGIAVGEAAASDIEALRAGDGRDAPTAVYGAIGPVIAGAWQVVPPQTVAQTPWVAFMRPFMMRSPSQFRAPPPPALTSAQYTADFIQTSLWGSSTSAFRNSAQTAIAVFWNGNTINQQNQAYRDVAVQHTMDLVDTVHLMAMGEVTAADAAIACFDSKYHYLAWRPYTAIRNADIDNNPATVAVPGWTPLLPTPNHPEYPSAHGCITSAFTHAIAEALGTNNIDLTLSGASAIGGPNNVTEHFATVQALQLELLDARVWGGLHWRNSDVVGEAVGNEMSDWALQRYFRPAAGGN